MRRSCTWVSTHAPQIRGSSASTCAPFASAWHRISSSLPGSSTGSPYRRRRGIHGDSVSRRVRSALPDGLRFRHERVTDLASAGHTTCCVRARARVCAPCNTVWVRSARMHAASASSTRGRSAWSGSPTALRRMPALTGHVTYRGSRADQIRSIPR